jgi:hypothetical protein
MLTTRQATLEDALFLAPRLRKADRQEIEALRGPGQEAQALLDGVRLSKPAYAICNSGGEVVGIYGAAPLEGEPQAAAIWMLGSDGLTADARSFLRQSRGHIKDLQDRYNLLLNCVDARNAVHIRWLQWLGFTFIQYLPGYGRNGEPFWEFVRIK